MHIKTLVGASFASLLTFAATAAANGVSDDRVSLPDGPGSISGIGENLSVDPNMGQMRYAVGFALPKGHPGASPSLGLSYSSGGAAGVVGVGWSLGVPSIERSSARGLPSYDEGDLFFAGGTELVAIGKGVYRARFEGGFVRYTWHQAGAGGYWEAEHPDGRRDFYGARANGTLVGSARASGTVVTGGEGTFSYMLVESVDVHGHVVRYEYDKLGGNHPLLSRVSYVFTGQKARYTVEFDYEEREDVISDCAPTFDMQLKHRLTEVRIESDGSSLSRYALAYEDYVSAGGVSRLVGVQRYGASGGAYPVRTTFAYSRTLDSQCTDCTEPVVVDMGTPAIAGGMVSGKTTLVDMNADGLPDLVHTESDGGHTFFENRLDSSMAPTFPTQGVASAVATGASPWDLSLPSVQAFDVNGDGLTDIYDRLTGTALCNDGSGDWNGSGCLPNPGAGDASFAEDADSDDGAEDPDPSNVRFLDFDNDKRIDWVRTDSAESTVVFRNTEAGFTSATVDAIGFQFDDVADNVMPSFADMNGDGMQDPARIVVTSDSAVSVEYRLNLGFGHWGPSVVIPFLGQNLQNARLSLEDVNGDGADDLVAVLSDRVLFAINRNGQAFDDFVSISAAKGADVVVPGLPTYTPGSSTVLFADMNGSGTSDIVWIDADGKVRFLELFRVRPNLMARIDNGLGGIQTVVYGTAAEQAKLAELEGKPWSRTLTQPMNVVVEQDGWVTLTGSEDGDGLHQVMSYRYADGYYDGVNKAFRGFADVERSVAESDSQQGGLERLAYDLGVDDPYRNGLLLSTTRYAKAGDSEVMIDETRSEYADCDVDGVPDTTALPVRYLCEVASETDLVEGLSAAERVTTRSESIYDGYGNVTLSSNLGVLDVDGDEAITETTYIAPGTSSDHPWMLNLASRVVNYGADPDLAAVTEHYYDGEPFMGLAAGGVERGQLTRTTRWVSATERVDTVRNRFDAHGNVIESIDPDGDPDDASAHRRRYTMDSEGLVVVRTEVFNVDAEGEPYALRREYGYHPTYNLPVLSSGWMVARGDSIVSPRNQATFVYDEFQRAIAVAQPGDTTEAPSVAMTYELGDPVSRIVSRRRSVAGADADIEVIRCVDGAGRTVQTRASVGDGSYHVDGFVAFNSRGRTVRSYQPYASDSAACETAPPAGVKFTETAYDAVGRVLRIVEPDAEDYGGVATVQRMAYGPLTTYTYDGEDADDSSPHADTPTVSRTDGLGRLVELSRYLSSGEEPAGTVLAYDGLGHLVRSTDAAGNAKRAEYDLLGRATRVIDPDRGQTDYLYDASGRVIAREDARGARTERTYDGLGRLVEQRSGDDGDQRVEMFYDFAPEGCDASDCSQGAGQITRRVFTLADGSEGHRDSGFDARGNTVYENLHVLGQDFVVTYGYDNLDRGIFATYPDGQIEGRTFDGVGRLTAIEDVVEEFGYADHGQRDLVRFANGAEQMLAFDARMRVASATTLDGDGKPLLSFSYSRDREGNLLEVADAGPAGLSQVFTYDAWYRPVRAEFVGEDMDESLDYTYDAVDRVLNRTSSLGDASAAHLGTLAYKGKAPHAVTKAGGIVREYDAAGQVTQRGETSLSWDYRGLLSLIARPGHETNLSYDDNGLRVVVDEDGSQHVYVSDRFEVRDGIGVWYARDGVERLARTETATLATRLYPDADEDGIITAHDAYAAAQDGDPRSVGALHSAARRLMLDARGDRVYLHQDHIHSIVAATGDDGRVIGSRSYYPNGMLRHADGFVDRYGFTGQAELSGTGLVQFARRVFDTQSGRWLSVDPKFELLSSAVATSVGEGDTAYAYIGNRGVNGFDPDGLERRGSTGQRTRKTPGGGRNRSKSAGGHANNNGPVRRRSSVEGGGAPARGPAVAEGNGGEAGRGRSDTFEVVGDGETPAGPLGGAERMAGVIPPPSEHLGRLGRVVKATGAPPGANYRRVVVDVAGYKADRREMQRASIVAPAGNAGGAGGNAVAAAAAPPAAQPRAAAENPAPPQMSVPLLLPSEVRTRSNLARNVAIGSFTTMVGIIAVMVVDAEVNDDVLPFM